MQCILPTFRTTEQNAYLAQFIFGPRLVPGTSQFVLSDIYFTWTPAVP